MFWREEEDEEVKKQDQEEQQEQREQEEQVDQEEQEEQKDQKEQEEQEDQEAKEEEEEEACEETKKPYKVNDAQGDTRTLADYSIAIDWPFNSMQENRKNAQPCSHCTKSSLGIRHMKLARWHSGCLQECKQILYKQKPSKHLFVSWV